MSNEENKKEILQYILDSKFALLNYVRQDLTPLSRAIGSFAPDGDDLYFSSSKESAKIGEIANNKRVSFYFEHDNQELENWKSLLLIGDAEPLSHGSSDFEKAVERIGARNPRFRERVANGDTANIVLYRISTRELEYLDRSKGNIPARKLVVG
ncbi:MAG: hypothetical protein HGB23_03220 [Chlorobiaceae bacterium]|nr:hypothetical protein [Chlorobiaceae bacterium]